jgi:hypothetical protein
VVTGTVIVSDTLLSSKSVSVAVVNVTSTTLAVHISFGHDPAGAVGVADVRFLNWPLRGVGVGPREAVEVVVKL